MDAGKVALIIVLGGVLAMSIPTGIGLSQRAEGLNSALSLAQTEIAHWRGKVEDYEAKLAREAEASSAMQADLERLRRSYEQARSQLAQSTRWQADQEARLRELELANAQLRAEAAQLREEAARPPTLPEAKPGQAPLLTTVLDAIEAAALGDMKMGQLAAKPKTVKYGLKGQCYRLILKKPRFTTCNGRPAITGEILARYRYRDDLHREDVLKPDERSRLETVNAELLAAQATYDARNAELDAKPHRWICGMCGYLYHPHRCGRCGRRLVKDKERENDRARIKAEIAAADREKDTLAQKRGALLKNGRERIEGARHTVYAYLDSPPANPAKPPKKVAIYVRELRCYVHEFLPRLEIEGEFRGEWD